MSKPKCGHNTFNPSCKYCHLYCYNPGLSTTVQLEMEQGYPEPKNGTALKDFQESIGNSISMDIREEDIKRLNAIDAVIDKLSGAVKLDNGKPPITLIPSEYIEGTAAVFGFGGKKYGNNNFRKGLAHSRCLDAALRHILSIIRGEELDPESGLPHVYHASCSLAMYDYMRTHYPELNDIHEQIKGGINDKKTRTEIG